jgi:hypothetical protein
VLRVDFDGTRWNGLATFLDAMQPTSVGVDHPVMGLGNFKLEHLTYVGERGDDGWISWSGGENPVPGRVVDTRHRDGKEHGPAPSHQYSAFCDWWKHEKSGAFGHHRDIIAFRLVEADKGSSADVMPTERETLYEAAERLFRVAYPDRDWADIKDGVKLSWASAAWDALKPSASVPGGVDLSSVAKTLDSIAAKIADGSVNQGHAKYVLYAASVLERITSVPGEGHGTGVLATDLALVNDLIYTHGGDAALAGWVRICGALPRFGPGHGTLHPATADLIDRFAKALKEKLERAEAKYGYSDGWLADDWHPDLVRDLAAHVQKGDPLDVAAYCAFAWHHGWPTADYRDDPAASVSMGTSRKASEPKAAVEAVNAELLEALKAVVRDTVLRLEDSDQLPSWVLAANAAIAKATALEGGQ